MNNLHHFTIFLCICIVTTMQEIYIKQSKNVNENDKDTCKRPCKAGNRPVICHYTFEIEWYHTLTDACHDCPYNITDCFRVGCIPGDGTKRGIVTINKKLPGPSIEVCQNDIIVVDVVNKMDSDATTIHWHGQLQESCPYMDGVPYITQCPIQPYNSFRYTFKASQAGTHFWHSHMGMQRVDGAFGPLIVRVPKEQDYQHNLYDFDLSSHTMIINDWETEIGEKVLLTHFYAGEATTPTSLLINGLGRFREFGNGYKKSFIPTARFKVDKGYRYRFRLINSGSLNCPIEISVDHHLIEIISSDGLDIKPITATSLITYAGERFDFILNANQKDGLYWIKFRGLLNCNEKHQSVFQVAVLEYKGFGAAPNSYPNQIVDYSSAHRHGIQVNPLNEGNESKNKVVPVSKMKAANGSWDESLKKIPDFQYYIGFDFNNISLKNFQWALTETKHAKSRLKIPQFNHVSMLNPSVALLSQRDELDDDLFCNNETVQGQGCIKMHCECVHGIKIPLGAVVELVFVDEGFTFEGSHPIHLHGYVFRVISMERIGRSVTVKEVKKRDAKGLIERNLLDAPFKDTISVPDGGYTIVRFIANNPGYWALHCHIETHMALGMTMILQVGEKSEMVPVPPNFPKCGQYAPEVSAFNSRQNLGAIIHSSLLLTSLSVLFVILILFKYINLC